MEKNNFCIAKTKGNRCSKLNVEKCMGESCSFAQTREGAEASCKKSFERLIALDNVIQIYIANKYYGGKMPWLNSYKNNATMHVSIDYSKFEEESIEDNASVEEAANNILSKQLKAFEELAK